MRVRVLGAGAGGGLPQWNCNCRNCDGVRKGTIRARPRTQSSIALSSDGSGWILFNASTEVLAIVLIDAQIDHTTGLLMLREGGRLSVYCTPQVREDLTRGNPIFGVLEHFCGVEWHAIAP